MTGSTSLDNKKSAAASSHATSPRAAAKRHWFIVMSQYLGSIKLALGAGTIFTIAMIVGTCLESWYSASIAQELIYYSWWFIGLLTLLAICIFFAAMKKWPWKKHQTGFLITHVGLLTMLAGGVLNFFYGVDGTMQLLDNKEIAEQNSLENRSRQVYLTQNNVVQVTRSVTDKDGLKRKETKEFPINTGAIPWGSSLGEGIPIPPVIKSLSMLANPFPRSMDVKPYSDMRLEVLGYLPHARIEKVEAAKEKEFGFPAIKVELNIKETGHNRPTWLGLINDPDIDLPPWFGSSELGMWIEFVGKCDATLVDEFLNPPTDEQRGTKGQLVFSIAGKKHRIAVAENVGKTVPLGDSGWKVALESYSPRMTKSDESEPPEMPLVRGKLISPEGKETKYAIASRLILYPGPLDHLDTPVEDLPAGLPAVWYHPPDLRYGSNGKYPNKSHIKSLLQFVQSSDKKLYYRSLIERDNQLTNDGAGPTPATGVTRTIWEKHAGSFLIEEHLPHAKPCTQRVVPVAKRPGLVSDETPAALLCRLTLYKKSTNGEMKPYSVERWFDLGRTVRFAITGNHDGESFSEPVSLGYSYKTLQLPFEIELTRAESQVDPGTNSAATYSSFVKVFDEDLHMNGTDCLITMNEPLNHRGFKVYQSNFTPAGTDPVSKKPIARSGFTVGRDPGLWLKYLGTAMIGIGIATMYYMKAYYITGKARPNRANLHTPSVTG
jgi:hypothetical protein